MRLASQTFTREMTANFTSETMKTNKLQKRIANLMPGNIPRWVRCYDNGGESGDRYTVCFTGRASVERSPGYAAEYPYRAMSAYPFDPQGIGMWGASKHRHCDVNKHGFAPAIGRKCHLGKRIVFADLPPDCQKLVRSDYMGIWNLK